MGFDISRYLTSETIRLNKITTRIFIILLVLSVPKANAQPGGVSIDSFSIVKTTPQSADLDLVGSNDGSNGIICLGAIAKSKDGSVRSEDIAPVYIAVGKQLHITARVMRPRGLIKPRTDTLLVKVYQCGKQMILTRKFDWLYEWPELPKDIQTNIAEEDTDLETKSPWKIFFQNLEDEDYAAMDMLLQNWNNAHERDEDGDWKLDSFRYLMNYLIQNRDPLGSIQRIQKWRKLSPRSPGAAIAEAKYWSAYAKQIRGYDTSLDVDPVAMRIFRERMKRAERILMDSKAYASGNPLWYETYLDVAVAMRRSGKFVEHLFDEAIRFHPYFQPLYVDMARYWAPRSGEKANWGKVDELVNKAVSLTADIDGISNYAHLYVWINDQQKFEFDIFQDSPASWIRMRDAFQDLVKRYPSNGNLNEFAVYACHAGDKDTYLRIRVQIQGRVVPNKWPGNYSLDTCDHMFMQYS